MLNSRITDLERRLGSIHLAKAIPSDQRQVAGQPLDAGKAIIGQITPLESGAVTNPLTPSISDELDTLKREDALLRAQLHDATSLKVVPLVR